MIEPAEVYLNLVTQLSCTFDSGYRAVLINQAISDWEKHIAVLQHWLDKPDPLPPFPFQEPFTVASGLLILNALEELRDQQEAKIRAEILQAEEVLQ